MFVSLVIAICLGLLSLAVGSVLLRFVGLDIEAPLRVEVARLAGLTTLFSLGALTFQLDLPTPALLIIVLLLVIAGLPNIISQLSSASIARFATFVRVRLTSWLAAFFYIVLMQPTLGSGWAFRTGPDSFGWSGAALAVCRGDTRSSLTARVVSQLNGTDLIAAFARPVKVGETSIAQIPSFTDQVAAEFLIGAHRTGLPSLLGSLCSLSGETIYSHFFVAFAALAVYTATRVIRLTARDNRVTPLLADGISLAAMVSIAPLSVTLEGGYGQLVTLPFLVLAISSLQKREFNGELFFLANLLLLMTALSSYLDLLYLAIPLIGGSYLVGLIGKLYSPVKMTFGKVLLTIGAVCLSWPMLGEIPRLVLNAGASAKLSGWHQGRLMLPDNLFGVWSSLPFDRYLISPRTSLEIALELTISFAVVGLIFTSPNRQRILGGFLLLGYLYLSYAVYFDAPSLNNYRVWKYSAYASVLFAFVLVGVVSKLQFREAGHTRFARTLRKGGIKSVSLILILITLISSLCYSIDWLNSKSETANARDAETIKSLTQKYELVFGPGLYRDMFTLYGDLRFGALNRGGTGIGNVSRDGSRQLVVVTKKSQEPSLQVFNAVADGSTFNGFKEIAKGDSIAAYLLLNN